MARKHPLDATLERYVRESTPPPGMVSARDCVIGRFRARTDTGLHDLAELEAGMREQLTLAANEALKYRLAEERRRADRTGERAWQVICGVLVAVIVVVLARAGFK